jgi:hypothetical protein
MQLPENTVEITSEAALLLIGSPQSTHKTHHVDEQYRMTTYQVHGIRIFAIFNFSSSRIAQYYVQDINA